MNGTVEDHTMGVVIDKEKPPVRVRIALHRTCNLSHYRIYSESKIVPGTDITSNEIIVEDTHECRNVSSYIEVHLV